MLVGKSLSSIRRRLIVKPERVYADSTGYLCKVRVLMMGALAKSMISYSL